MRANHHNVSTMLSRSFSLFTLILGFGVFLGCSAPESNKRLDTVLCWLRPSCLPAQPPQSKAPKPPTVSKPAPAQPKAKKIQQASSPKVPSVPCLTSAKATILASKPFVTVSYVEPTTKANGQALTNLAKTTIYHDLGNGLVKYKDIPATNPQGGGKVQEKVSFVLGEGNNMQTTICVTATNVNGQEG